MLIKPLPHSYKVPRRPFESARLDAELKVFSSFPISLARANKFHPFSSPENTVSATSAKSGAFPSSSPKFVVLLVSS